MAKRSIQNSKRDQFFGLNNIVSSMPESVYWKDSNGCYRGCNELFFKVLGFNSVDEVIGINDYDIGKKIGCDKSVVEKIIQVDKEIFRTGRSVFNIEEPPFKIADGTIIWQRTSKVPIKNKKGEVIGIIGISIDFTKQKQAEMALAEQVKKTELAYKRNSEFLSIAGHEIRGPISNVISLLNLMSKEIKDKKNKKLLELLGSSIEESENSIKSMDYLLKILDLSDETFEYKNTQCNLKDFIESVLENIRNENQKSSINLNYKIAKGITKEVKFDHYHLMEILEILIRNSIKYSSKKPEISVNIKENGKNLIFSVKDKGIGIPKNYLKHLLSPLLIQSESKNTISKYTKPSIKLSYINKILNFIDGKLEVKSKVGVGSEFIVYVPFEKEINENFQGRNIKSLKIKNNKLKVLIVEDNLVTLKINADYLLELGHSVDTAKDGYSAIKLATHKKYDIIFLDITLPDISGIEVMDKINTINEGHAIFVAVTSHYSQRDISFFHEHEFATILDKPVSKKDFEGCIDTIQKMKNEAI